MEYSPKSKYLLLMTDKTIIKEMLRNKLTELTQPKVVAGVLVKCLTTGNVFLLYRNDKTPVWGLVSGKVDAGESVIDGLKREVKEELSINPDIIKYKFVRVEEVPEKNIIFNYFEGFCQEEFKPTLDHENLKYIWASPNNLPSPLFHGLLEKIKNI